MYFTTLRYQGAITTRDLNRDPLSRLAPLFLDIEVELAYVHRQDALPLDIIRDRISTYVDDHYKGTVVISNRDNDLVEMMNLAEAKSVHLIIVDHVDLAGIAEDIYKASETQLLRYFTDLIRHNSWDGVPVERQIHPYRVTVRSGDESATFLRTGTPAAAKTE